MTAMSSEDIKTTSTDSDLVRTGTDTFTESDKAATERTGGGNKISLHREKELLLQKDWSKIKENLSSGNLAPFISKVLKFLPPNNPRGKTVDVLEEDWDYLIILDACRYDVFKEVNWLEGNLSRKRSKGNTSLDFLKSNFKGSYPDINYLSSNPFVHPDIAKSVDGKEEFEAWEHFDYIDPIYMEEDSQEIGVTNPESVSDRAKTQAKLFPDKRNIFHYMQPHTPFIGKNSSDISSIHGEYGELLRQGHSSDEIREMYKSNLKRALQSVEDLITDLSGKVVVTADHGEFLGDFGLWGHPHDIYLRPVVEVPWLEIDAQGGENP